MECIAGMCGFSMGGVHASMVASLYPGDVACTPLLAPRSASGAFCHGALRSATSWAPLAAVVDEKQQVIFYHQLLKSMKVMFTIVPSAGHQHVARRRSQVITLMLMCSFAQHLAPHI